MGGPIDSAVFHWINGWSPSLVPVMRFFSEAANYLWFKCLLLALVVFMIAKGGKPRLAAIQALVAFPIANGVTDLFKAGLPMHRPFQVEEAILRLGASDSMGTASAHSANMAAVAFVFAYHLRWPGSLWIVIALMTGLSRVYNGVHYPSQVLLGWVCGVCAGLLVTKTWELILNRRQNVTGEESHGHP